MKNKACFLDRDGVLIHEKCYLYKPEEVEIYTESYNAISALKSNGFKIIVVTNQAGVARGFFKEADILKVHAEIDRQLSNKNLSIDAYYYCPHHPNGIFKEYSIDCECRKPKPNMILQASKDLNIELSMSFLIGDKISDLLAAKNAGCQSALVKTGHGIEYVEKAEQLGFKVFDNIDTAVNYFLKY